MGQQTGFAVVDVETTGLFPSRHDRIIELAILRTDSRGNVLREYSTLLNPERDIGPTYIHGLSTKHVINAPTFQGVVADVSSLLAGAVFVAHNARFDLGFIRAEMRRIGVAMPRIPVLCTIRLTRRTDPTIPVRRLGDICEYYEIPVGNAHSALDDARATAELLRLCLARLGYPDNVGLAELGVNMPVPPRHEWPSGLASTPPQPRWQSPRTPGSASYIARLISRLPTQATEAPNIVEYLGLLDRVLEDRCITMDESEALFTLASEYGLSRDQVRAAHERYVGDLVEVALGDGVITENEESDLNEVCELLGISDSEFQAILQNASNKPRCSRADSVFRRESRAEVEGKSVCFSGTFRCWIHGELATRSLAEEIAHKYGLTVRQTVSRKLDYLVVADGQSMSRKAKRARQLGVRIIVEPVFWQMLGIPYE